jgi:hypothetical protein
MSTAAHPYTTQLQAGLGLFDETRTLLEFWQPGMDGNALKKVALASGRFPALTARRLRNIVIESFAPRYLVDQAEPALILKRLKDTLAPTDLRQLMLLYTSRANPVLAGFIREAYWPAYAAGAASMDNEGARAFIQRGIEDGKTATRWAEGTVKRVARYLTSACADFGLLEGGSRSRRRILRIRMASQVVAILAHDLHFKGIADNALLAHEDWALYGLERQDVLEEFRRLALQNLWIVQAAGDAARIGWQCKDMETVCDVIAQS